MEGIKSYTHVADISYSHEHYILILPLRGLRMSLGISVGNRVEYSDCAYLLISTIT